MSGRKPIREALNALQVQFSSTKPLSSLPQECRRPLQHLVEDQLGKFDQDESAHINQELRSFWSRYVRDNSTKAGAFVGALRELRPAIINTDNVWEWFVTAVKPVICSTGYGKAAVADAQDFLVGVMTSDDADAQTTDRVRLSSRLCADLLSVHIARTRSLAEEELLVAPDNTQIAQQVEAVLFAFGRKQPRSLFNALDDLLVKADTRLQALTLLSSFTRQQTPHLYLVIQTPLVEHLLRCLMNDTSTTVLSVALTSLIMLLPHIPSSLNSSLPRLFLIYSRLLCWEKFSPLSSEAQRNLVTDDRVSTGPADDEDFGDVGVDRSWQKCRPKDGLIEAATPELMTYFTYLYGLYPLNFMSYIRKPRRYLKNANFPAADDFDLDQAVIRSRSDQFRQAHVLHPNFYTSTIEEELVDPKWPKMDPADVVAECHGLCVSTKTVPLSPGPPPTARLPDLPPVPIISDAHLGSISPSISHVSLRSGHSWRDGVSTTVANSDDSPILGPRHMDDELHTDGHRPRSKTGVLTPGLDDFPLPIPRREKHEPPQTNLAYLQRELTLLRNELNFERWHKAQYSQHIGQLMRKNVKDTTVEAETLNLINANRALKQQLEQVRSEREATIRDSTLTRKQANNLETNMTDRLARMKKEQEIWVADGDELQRLRREMKQYRDLLSEAESRELNKSHQVEIMKREVAQLQKTQAQYRSDQDRLRDYEHREFDFDQAKREQEILQNEKETLHLRIQRHEQERERTKKMFTDRIAELEAQLSSPGPHPTHTHPATTNPDTQTLIAQAVAEWQSKFSHIKKVYARLMEKYTDLELEYQSVKTQLDEARRLGAPASPGDAYSIASSSHHHANGSTSYIPTHHDRAHLSGPGDLASPVYPFHGPIGVLESVYDVASEYGAPAASDAAYTGASNSDPTSRRYAHPGAAAHDGHPLSPTALPLASEATMHSAAGLTWKSSSNPGHSKNDSARSSGVAVTFNQTAPLAADERSVLSGHSASSAQDRVKKEKIKPDSEVRVYGRGGAQNIKMKTKEPSSSSSSSANADDKKPKKIGSKMAWLR